MVSFRDDPFRKACSHSQPIAFKKSGNLRFIWQILTPI
jgi:hypothetical protein